MVQFFMQTCLSVSCCTTFQLQWAFSQISYSNPGCPSVCRPLLVSKFQKRIDVTFRNSCVDCCHQQIFSHQYITNFQLQSTLSAKLKRCYGKRAVRQSLRRLSVRRPSGANNLDITLSSKHSAGPRQAVFFSVSNSNPFTLKFVKIWDSAHLYCEYFLNVSSYRDFKYRNFNPFALILPNNLEFGKILSS